MTRQTVTHVHPVRPALKKGLRVLHRDTRTLQVGLDPERAVVLVAPSPAIARLVAALDGRAELGTLARRHGIPVDTVARVVDELEAAGVLESAEVLVPHEQSTPAGLATGDDRTVLHLVGGHGPGSGSGRSPRTLRRIAAAVAEQERRLEPDVAAWALADPPPGDGKSERYRRAAATVQVLGAERVGTAVALLLAAAGIGQVVAGDDRLARHGDTTAAGLGPVDLGRPRRAGLRRRIAEIAPGVRLLDTHPLPGLVVVTDGGLDTAVLRRLRVAGTAHLVVGVREARGWVGPLVVPGRTSCTQCHHLARADRDPAWALLVDQLDVAARPAQHLSAVTTCGPAGPKVRGTPRVAPAVEACDGVLATLVAATAVLHALTWLGGQVPPSVDGTVEFRLPDGVGRRRGWSVHPGCACTGTDAPAP